MAVFGLLLVVSVALNAPGAVAPSHGYHGAQQPHLIGRTDPSYAYTMNGHYGDFRGPGVKGYNAGSVRSNSNGLFTFGQGVGKNNLGQRKDEAKVKMEEAIENANKMAAKCSEPDIQKDDQAREDCYSERDQAFKIRDAATEKFYAINNELEEEKSGSNNNKHGVTGTAVLINTGEFNADSVGQTYRVKIQRKFVNGDCNEHWEIGLSRLEKFWEPAFDVKCKSKGSSQRVNGPSMLLVNNPDDSFCFFSNNPSLLTVIKDETCTKYEYDNDGNKKSERVLSNSDCDQEKKSILDFIKAEEERANVFANIDVPSPSVTDTGPYYTVELSNVINGGKLENKISIIRRVDNKLLEDFIVPCSSSTLGLGRLIDGEEAMVGEPDDKFFVFTMKKTQDSLIVFLDGKCKRKTYSDLDVHVSTYKDEDCMNIKERIKVIQANIKARPFRTQNGKKSLNADIDSLEKDLIKQLAVITPESETSYKKPATKNTSPTFTSTNSKADKHGGANKMFEDAVADRGRSISITDGEVKTIPSDSDVSSKI